VAEPATEIKLTTNEPKISSIHPFWAFVAQQKTIALDQLKTAKQILRQINQCRR
jgi:hypothetical protein